MKKTLNFFDLRTKTKFNSRNYTKTTRTVKGTKRYFAIAISPSGTESWRAISKQDYNQ